MKNAFLILASLIFFNSPAYALKDHILPAGHEYPNGITHDNQGNLYVGFISSGAIFKKNRNDQEWTILLEDSENIYSVAALRFDRKRNLVWGTSPDIFGIPSENGETIKRTHRVFAINAETGAVEKLIDLPDNGFANDIAIDKDGEIFISNSNNPNILKYSEVNESLVPHIINPLFDKGEDRFGMSGIGVTDQGTLYVTMHGRGKLYQAKDGEVRELELPRLINYPDGLNVIDENTILVLESNLENEYGRLVLIDLDDNLKGTLTILEDGFISPVNLTRDANTVFISESGFRGFMSGELQEPNDTFRVIEINLE